MMRGRRRWLTLRCKTRMAVKWYRKIKNISTLDTVFYLSFNDISSEFIETFISGYEQIKYIICWVVNIFAFMMLIIVNR